MSECWKVSCEIFDEWWWNLIRECSWSSSDEVGFGFPPGSTYPKELSSVHDHTSSRIFTGLSYTIISYNSKALVSSHIFSCRSLHLYLTAYYISSTPWVRQFTAPVCCVKHQICFRTEDFQSRIDIATIKIEWIDIGILTPKFGCKEE